MNRHWTDDELIAKLYAVGPEEPARTEHLATCAECAARWSAVESRRIQFVRNADSVVVDDARLRAQRDAVWRRLEEARRPRLWRLAPAGATAMLMLFALLLHTPTPTIEPVQVASNQQISDEQLFSEIASMVNEVAPRVAAPIQGLFDASAVTEVQ
jgi:anti-sigma factor RsiW